MTPVRLEVWARLFFPTLAERCAIDLMLQILRRKGMTA